MQRPVAQPSTKRRYRPAPPSHRIVYILRGDETQSHGVKSIYSIQHRKLHVNYQNGHFVIESIVVSRLLHKQESRLAAALSTVWSVLWNGQSFQAGIV